MTTTPTPERLKREWRAIFKGWERRGFPKDEKSPALRLAEKYKMPCQEVLKTVGRAPGPANPRHTLYVTEPERQPGESRQDWNRRTFVLRYSEGWPR